MATVPFIKSKVHKTLLLSFGTKGCKQSSHLVYTFLKHSALNPGLRLGLRIDTGAWDVIGVVVCISYSIPHRLISNTPYERSIFLLLNCIKHVNIN